jgi:hypothetical protein
MMSKWGGLQREWIKCFLYTKATLFNTIWHLILFFILPGLINSTLLSFSIKHTHTSSIWNDWVNAIVMLILTLFMCKSSCWLFVATYMNNKNRKQHKTGALNNKSYIIFNLQHFIQCGNFTGQNQTHSHIHEYDLCSEITKYISVNPFGNQLISSSKHKVSNTTLT